MTPGHPGNFVMSDLYTWSLSNVGTPLTVSISLFYSIAILTLEQTIRRVFLVRSDMNGYNKSI